MSDDDRGQGVSLGCGTLILIALIVLFFSNRGQDDLEREIRQLRSEVGELRKSVEAQTILIKSLQTKADEPSPRTARPDSESPE